MHRHATELEARGNKITQSAIIEKTPEADSLFSKISSTVTNYVKMGKRISDGMALYEMHGFLRNHWAARKIRWRPKSDLHEESIEIDLHQAASYSHSTQEASPPALNIPPETWQRALRKAGYDLRKTRTEGLTSYYHIVRGENEVGEIENDYLDEFTQCPLRVNIMHEENFEPVIKALFGYREFSVVRGAKRISDGKN